MRIMIHITCNKQFLRYVIKNATLLLDNIYFSLNLWTWGNKVMILKSIFVWILLGIRAKIWRAISYNNLSLINKYTYRTFNFKIDYNFPPFLYDIKGTTINKIQIFISQFMNLCFFQKYWLLHRFQWNAKLNIYFKDTKRIDYKN